MTLHAQQNNGKGRYGGFGGCYAPEILIAPLQELELTFAQMQQSEEFQTEFTSLLRDYAGRPTALTEVPNFASAIQGPRVFLKREDLLHTGAHKLNNALGQCLLAKQIGKKRIIAETGAGQHGLAVATACAKLSLECVVYMGAVDINRQMPNVEKMRLLGATVESVSNGAATLKDAINEAMRDWSASFETSHYCLGSALGPHPFPAIVKELQLVIGTEARAQILERINKLPDLLIACVGGGSNAIGFLAPFLADDIKMIGVEAGGRGLGQGDHAARFATGRPGVLHGCYTYLLQDDDGQVLPTHSVSAGLDYPAVGPEHAALFEQGRVDYVAVEDEQAVEALKCLSQTEGIIPALESSHALAHLVAIAPSLAKDSVVVVNLSGRGDKDLPTLFADGKL